jgi:hypothetical protein
VKLEAAKNKFMWNGAIRSVYISYLETTMTCGAQIGMLIHGSIYQKAGEKATGLVILAYLVTVMIFWARFIKRNEEHFPEEAYKAKFDNFTTDIRTQGEASRWNKYFFVAFFVRRFVFVAIPVLVQGYPWLRIQLLLATNTIYVSLYMHFRPHIGKVRTQIEIFNEIMMMMVQYHLILFSDFTYTSVSRYEYANVYVGLISFIIFVNIVRVVWEMVKGIKAKKARELKLKAQEKEAGVTDKDNKL